MASNKTIPISLHLLIGRSQSCLNEFFQEQHDRNLGFVVYGVDDFFYIIKFIDEIAVGAAVFTNERSFVCEKNLSPIDFLSDAALTTIDKFKQKYGKWHFDIGSGVSIPAYLTSCFALAILSSRDDGAMGVTMFDIISKTVVQISD